MMLSMISLKKMPLTIMTLNIIPSSAMTLCTMLLSMKPLSIIKPRGKTQHNAPSIFTIRNVLYLVILSMMTIGTMTPSLIMLSMMPLSIMTLNIMPLSIRSLCIRTRL
jgi:hypothetical protein